MTERADLVTKLVRSGPLSEHDLVRLNSFGWDSDQTLVTLTKADVCAALDRHVRGELSADDLVRWADQIEAREDIGFGAEYEDALDNLIFELANPTIHTEPTSAVAQRWLEALT
jgi:hypothetical protein